MKNLQVVDGLQVSLTLKEFAIIEATALAAGPQIARRLKLPILNGVSEKLDRSREEPKRSIHFSDAIGSPSFYISISLEVPEIAIAKLHRHMDERLPSLD